MSAIELPEHNVDPKCALEHTQKVTLLLTVIDFYISDHPSFSCVCSLYSHNVFVLDKLASKIHYRRKVFNRLPTSIVHGMCLRHSIYWRNFHTDKTYFDQQLGNITSAHANVLRRIWFPSFISGMSKIIFLMILWSNFNVFKERNLICADFRGAS